LHVQIVLVPGVNDGVVLDRTLGVARRAGGRLSVGIVPLGYTRHQDAIRLDLRRARCRHAAVIEQVARWQFAMKERDGVSWVHLADEFYLNARAPMPDAEWYDGFPQYENGIGLVRSFRR
jgi:NifB/MoaA-like Fe-S oxidoreductase